MTESQQTTTSNKDRILAKIKALLAKTTENGATEHEALAALSKAKELMLENLVNYADLKEENLVDLIVVKKCVLRDSRSMYDFTSFTQTLATLFDCQMYYHTGVKHIIFFFGLKEDTELCDYFAKFIKQAFSNELTKYRNSDKYHELTGYGIHGKTVLLDFSKGFFTGIIKKIDALYRERNLSKHAGLIIAKAAIISNAFDTQINPKKVGNNLNPRYRETYEHGISASDDVELIQGLNAEEQAQAQALLSHINKEEIKQLTN